MTDLPTTGNTLSVFILPESEEKELEERVAVAMAANRDNLDHFEYGLFQETLLSRLALRFRQTPGNTPDSDVNALHYEIEELTGSSLLDLATAMSRAEEKRFERLTKTQVSEKLSAAISGTRIDRQRMNRRLRETMTQLNLI